MHLDKASFLLPKQLKWAGINAGSRLGRLHPHLIADEVGVTWALRIEDVTPRTANNSAQDAPRTLKKVSSASSGSCHQGQLVPALVLGLPDHPGAVEDDLLSSSPSFF